MDDLVKRVRDSFSKSAIPAQALLSKFKYLNTNLSERAFFYDPKYFPFYFHLGRHLESKSLLDMTLGVGIPTSCFLLGCKTVERVSAFHRQETEHYPIRLAKHNIRTVYKGPSSYWVGNIDDLEFQKNLKACEWDAVIISIPLSYDDCLSYLRLIWPSVSRGGLLIMDHVNYDKAMEQAFHDFARTNNRKTETFDTKYGVGLIFK